jgi:hypothetical protein
MNGATNKNAPLTGQGIGRVPKPINSNKNLSQNELPVNNVPQWMQEKVARLVSERALIDGTDAIRALAALEGESFITLQGELAAFPSLANWIPQKLCQTIRNGSYSALSEFELAAFVIIDADAAEVAPCAKPDDLVEFLNLKWESLAELLKGGDYE